MICLRKIGDTPEDLAKVKALYYRSFPKNERRQFAELVENRFGNTEVFSFYDGNVFVGMACLLNSLDISHIIYLAIDESLRGQGYGSAALKLLHQSKRERRLIVDIELPDPQAENAEQRMKRKKFYLRAGYEESPIQYEWRHERYEILSFGGQISEDEFEKFWENL